VFVGLVLVLVRWEAVSAWCVCSAGAVVMVLTVKIVCGVCGKWEEADLGWT
jgi:hypothetical protein